MDVLAEELQTRLIKLPNYGQDTFLFALEYALGTVQVDRHEIARLDKARRALYDLMIAEIQSTLKKAKKAKNKKRIDESLTYLNLMRDFNQFKPNFSDDIMIGQMAFLKKTIIVKITDETDATVYIPKETSPELAENSMELSRDNIVFLLGDSYSDAFEYPAKISSRVLEYLRTNITGSTDFPTFDRYDLELGRLLKVLSVSEKQKMNQQRYPQNLLTASTRRSVPKNDWKQTNTLKNWKKRQQSQRPARKTNRSMILSIEPLQRKPRSIFSRPVPPKIHRSRMVEIPNHHVELNVVEVPNKNVKVEIPKPNHLSRKNKPVAPRSQARYSRVTSF